MKADAANPFLIHPATVWMFLVGPLDASGDAGAGIADASLAASAGRFNEANRLMSLPVEIRGYFDLRSAAAEH